MHEITVAVVEYEALSLERFAAHTAPRHPLRVDEAHRVMREHRACPREDCVRKQAAWETLVEARRIVPDAGRQR